MAQSYWFQYSTANGVIYPQPISETAPASSSSMGVLGPYPIDTASSQVVMAYNYPERFLAQGSPVALVEQPYFTLDATESTTPANEWTLIATLNNPPATLPTIVTFNLPGSGTATATLTNNQATLTVNVHPSLVNAPLNVSVGASGCATSRATNIGGSTNVSVAVQTYTPSGGNLTVAPTGMGSKAFLEGYYALSKSVQKYLADIGTAINLMSDVTYRKVFALLRVVYNLYEWATKLPTNEYVPTAQDTTDLGNIEFNTNEASAVDDIVANVLPNLFTTLNNAFPSGGTEQLQYKNYATDLATTFKNFENYMNDLQNIPNLA